ncbi:MAG: hypothetical protein FWG40_01280 [Peptococcaceae bacterium]|nr:hypothetical protein [Peptococcaceae bacterium]
MKKSFVLLLTLFLTFSAGLSAFAALDIPQAGEDGFVEDELAEVEEYSFQNTLDCCLSEPVVTRQKGTVTYTTTLLIKNMSEFYGYQIQVLSPAENRIEIDNKTGGIGTPNVYKDGKTSFAAIIGEGAKGDIEVCTITSQYPYRDKNKDRMLVVDQFEVVSSIMAERTIALDSPALTLRLPYAGPPFYASLWFIITIVAVLVLGGTAALLMRYKQLGISFVSGIQSDFSKGIGFIKKPNKRSQASDSESEDI